MKKFWQKIKALFTKSDVEKTSLQKTAKISIILGCCVLVGAIVYFAAIAPLLRAEENYVPTLFDGEVYQNKSIYILRQYERSEIKSVEIKNEKDFIRGGRSALFFLGLGFFSFKKRGGNGDDGGVVPDIA